METQQGYRAAYAGSKNFSQHDVKTANANGFAAAADDYMERGIDLNEQLILNKPATFFFRMNGDAMMEDGIFNGDVLIVDRSIKPSSGKIIVAILDGELLVRRIQRNPTFVELQCANKRMSNIQLHNFDDRSHVWGVVTCVIHVLERSLFVTKNKSEFNQKDKYGKAQRFY
ncbi:LexA family protein [Parafilimonas sp.]|uniref:LexA family protein n=1 Tax=Parafilimonas sp. TaxID=1969739 RepID=UPI003F7EB535